MDFSPPLPMASGIRASWRHLVLLGLAQSKPGLDHWACSGQAQAELDGGTVRVYPGPMALKVSEPDGLAAGCMHGPACPHGRGPSNCSYSRANQPKHY